ncbi:hypothetical protein BGZ76_000118 [Entomortierella beljakovae]|nr:hypothetical protein BGZ76_000118 [Entomortierella beljakovae]
MNLDGGYNEGGGQIIRNGLSYSALLQSPLTVTNIRNNRPNPGLRNQHLTGIRLVREITNGKLEGDTINSTTVHFQPSKLEPSGSKYLADAITAGSICLMIQITLPVLIFCPPAVDPSHSMENQLTQVIMKANIFNPMFSKLFTKGKELCNLHIDRHGYSPNGGGQVTMTIDALEPKESLTPATLMERGTVVRIKGCIYSAGKTNPKIALDLKERVLKILKESEYGGIETLDEDITVVHDSNCIGGASGINLVAETTTGCIFGGGSLGGTKKKTNEQTAKEACEVLLQNLRHGGCVDECLQDMLIIFMALAHGKSQIVTGPLTPHTLTAFYVAKVMTGVDFSHRRLPAIEGNELNPDHQERYLVECEGIGHVA